MKSLVLAVSVPIFFMLSGSLTHSLALTSDTLTRSDRVPDTGKVIHFDGVTLSDFNAALATACDGKNPGKLLLPPGNATFPMNVNNIPGNCTVWGAGGGPGCATTLTFAPIAELDALITVGGNVSNVDLGYFCIQGNSNSGRGISLINDTNVRLHDIQISGLRGLPKSAPFAAFYLGGGGSDIWLTDNISTGNGPPAPTGSENADFLVNSGPPHFNRIHVERNKVLAGFMQHGAFAMHDCSDCDIIDNYVDQNNKIGGDTAGSGWGISLYKIGTITRVRIIGNAVSNTAGTGIYCAGNDGISSVTITANSVSNAALQQTAVSHPVGGIALADVDNSTISGNTIASSAQDAIVLQPIYSQADGNVISNNTIRFAAVDGVHIIGAVHGGLLVANNTIEDVKGIGVHQTTSAQGTITTNAIVRGNIIARAGSHGILFQAATDSQFIANQVNALASGFQGIVVSDDVPGTHNKIAENVIDASGAGAYGINVSSSFTTVDGNLIHDAVTTSIIFQSSAVGGTITANFCHSGVRCIDSSAASHTYITGNREIGLSGADQYAATDLLEDRNGIEYLSLPALANGSVVYCTDCTMANPCAGGGKGAIAKYLNGIKVCN